MTGVRNAVYQANRRIRIVDLLILAVERQTSPAVAYIGVIDVLTHRFCFVVQSRHEGLLCIGEVDRRIYPLRIQQESVIDAGSVSPGTGDDLAIVYARRVGDEAVGFVDVVVSSLNKRKTRLFIGSVVPGANDIPTVVNAESLGLCRAGIVDGTEGAGHIQKSVIQVFHIAVVSDRLVRIVNSGQERVLNVGIIDLLKSSLWRTCKTVGHVGAVDIRADNDSRFVDARASGALRAGIIERGKKEVDGWRTRLSLPCYRRDAQRADSKKEAESNGGCLRFHDVILSVQPEPSAELSPIAIHVDGGDLFAVPIRQSLERVRLISQTDVLVTLAPRDDPVVEGDGRGSAALLAHFKRSRRFASDIEATRVAIWSQEDVVFHISVDRL